MGRKKTACQTCASIKAKCSKGQPCARCKRLSLTCAYGRKPTRLQESNGGSSHTKVWHSRSTKGCASCRRRRKKCDEQQPTCGDCQRLKVACIWMVPYPQELSSSQPSLPRLVENENGPSSTPTTLRCPSLLQPQLSDGVELSPDCPGPLCTNSNPHDSWLSSMMNQLSEGGVSLSASPLTDWIALIGEDDYPTSVKAGRCIDSVAQKDLPMPCANDDEVGLATFLPPTALNILTGVSPKTLASWNVAERHLLNHYLQSVSRALVVVDDKDNPFLHVVIPLALENTTVKHSLLALSACHLARVYPDWGRDVFIHRSRALRGLKHNLGDPQNVLWALTTTLLLCLVEICEGSSRRWLLHLHGAKALLADVIGSSKIQSPFNPLIELYNYLCCTTSITYEDVPSAFNTELRSDGNHAETSLVTPVFGVFASLYQPLIRINRLICQTRKEITPNIAHNINLEVQEIEVALQSWVPEKEASQSRHTSEIRAAAVATQWALIMRLQQATRKSRSDDLQIKKATNNILSALSLIRPGSEVETQILFPLFMAGVGSMTKPDRLTVEYRLNIMETTVGFGNISVAHRLLDDIWQRANGGDVVDWQTLMRTTCPGLVLF